MRMRAKTALIGLAAIAIGVQVVPGSWLFEVHNLSYLPTHEVLLDKEAIRPRLTVSSSRSVNTVDNGVLSAVCFGTSTWQYRQGRAAVKLPLEAWVGDNTCLERMEERSVYFLRMRWRLQIGPYVWTGAKESEPFIYCEKEATCP